MDLKIHESPPLLAVIQQQLPPGNILFYSASSNMAYDIITSLQKVLAGNVHYKIELILALKYN